MKAQQASYSYAKNFRLPLVMVRTTKVNAAHQQLFKILRHSVTYIKLGKPIELHGGGATSVAVPERLGQDKAYVIDSRKARSEFGVGHAMARMFAYFV